MTKKKLTKEPTTYYLTLLDGKQYKLPILNLNMLADLEDEFELGLNEISKLQQERPASSLKRILYALLHRGYPDITRDKVAGLIDMNNLESASETIAKALSGK